MIEKRDKVRRKDWVYIVRNLFQIAEAWLSAWPTPLIPKLTDDIEHIYSLKIIVNSFISQIYLRAMTVKDTTRTE